MVFVMGDCYFDDCYFAEEGRNLDGVLMILHRIE